MAFEFNTEQVYLMAFSDGRVDVYPDPEGGEHDFLDTPWSAAQIAQINWTQSADTLLIVHPEVPPKKITRQADGSWSIDDWAFFEEDATGDFSLFTSSPMMT